MSIKKFKNMGLETSNSFYYKICKICYIMGLPNFWIEDLKQSTFATKYKNVLWRITDVIVVLWVVSEVAAHFTQHDLDAEQKADLIVFSIAHPFMVTYYFCLYYYRENIKEVMRYMVINFKEISNMQSEQQMLKRSTIFLGLFSSFFAAVLVVFAIKGVKHGTFVTVVTAWPDANDRSAVARFWKTIMYAIWCIFVGKMILAYLMIIPHFINLSIQYKNLCRYFCSLNEIFDENITQETKERKFENAFKKGIKMHSDIIRCMRLTSQTSYWICGAQIISNVSTLIFFLAQMLNSERKLGDILVGLQSAVAMLISTGCFVWNAGNISVEASNLAAAIYSSGWYNCRGASAKWIRTLVTITMWQSQRPVEIKCFGTLTLSYETYLAIVRLSHSFFSVLY